MSGKLTLEDLADRVDCIANNVARILLLLSKENLKKKDESVRRRERCW